MNYYVLLFQFRVVIMHGINVKLAVLQQFTVIIMVKIAMVKLFCSIHSHEAIYEKQYCETNKQLNK